MSDSLNKLRSLFSIGLDPVLVVKNNKLMFINPAAEKIFSNLKVNDEADRIIPAELLELDSSSYISSAVIDGKTTIISCASISGYNIYTFNFEDNERLCVAPSTMIASMKSSIFTLRMAMDKLVAAVDMESNKNLPTYSAILYHNYHLLLHYTGNLHAAENLLNGTMPFQPISADIVSVCKDLVSSVHSFVSQDDVQISFHCEEEFFQGDIDKTLFEQMLLNLMSNSLRSMSSGGRISLSLETSDTDYTITVSDNGAEIPPQLLSSLFSLTESSSIPDISNNQSSLNFFIARGIAKLHNGIIIVESSASSGTTARIIIPIKNNTYTVLRTTELEYRASGLNSILTELSSFLDHKHYTDRFLGD